MRQIRELYNIMAVALRNILNGTKERDFERLRNIEPSYERSIIENIKRIIPQLFDMDTLNVAELSERQLRDGFLVGKLAHCVASTKDMTILIYLVKHLDIYLEDSVYRCIPIDQDIWRFESLNDNFRECGLRLLPRLACNWEHKNRDAYHSYTMLFYMKNFYYVNSKEEEEYIVEHILLPQTTFYHALKRGELCVCVSPVTGENVVQVTEKYTRDNEELIAVEPLVPEVEQRLQEQILSVLEKAALQKADILLLPELLGSTGIRVSIQLELEKRQRIPDNEFPKLTVCPSAWEERRNSCAVLDDMGELLFEQQKHYGADLKKWGAKEDIVSDKKIYILHCKGVGRVAIAICKDFLMTSYLEILIETLKVNLLLVPSFTTGDYQFKTCSDKYGYQDCDVVWVNTCASRWSNSQGQMTTAVTRAYLPGKWGNSRLKAYMEELCDKQYKCDGTCLYTYGIRLEEEEHYEI
ncbi:MAG: hypothetical protein HFI33_14705 [Lachnospiraceae bacterium]|nr:hypothetical protein [Lachnospiraceae bacterium]